MNHWIESEILRLRSGTNATRYGLQKAKYLEAFRWFQHFALVRQLEALQQQEQHERDLKAAGTFNKQEQAYAYVHQKPFKIKVLKQLLRHTAPKR
jgi:hypothetical protein